MKTTSRTACISIFFLAVGAALGHYQAASTRSDDSPAAKRVTGIGGIFFKCKDPAKLRSWYAEHLGLQTDKYGTTFEWRQADDGTRKGFTQWSAFSDKTTYFKPSEKEFMINYRVENLERLVAQLDKEGIALADKIEVVDYGKFCHVMDPEGNKIELWEPNDVVYDKAVQARTK